MPNKCKFTTDSFISEAKKIHGDKYDYSKVEYINTKTKVCIICPIHGEFLCTPNNHLSGKGCKYCSHRSFKYTTEEFINKAKSIHGDKYDYSKVNYINNSTKICIICPIHGEFWKQPNHHLNGYGCNKCSKINNTKNEKNKYDFIKKAKEIHGDKYDYSKVEYINSKNKVCIICKEHGEFYQTPNKHIIRKHGCPLCNGGIKSNTKDFIKKAKEVHGNKYDYSKVEYINANTKVCIICSIHGEFWQTPHNHLNGCGCPYCNESHLERNIMVLLINNNIEFERQKKFDWLGLQSLDFYLPQYNIAIECQGIQHFEEVEHFGGKKGFEITIERDKRKYLLCNDNGVKILYYSNIKEYCEINTMEKLLNEILKHETFYITT